MGMLIALLCAAQEEPGLRPREEAASLLTVSPRISWWWPTLDGRLATDDRTDDTGPSFHLDDDLSFGGRAGLPFMELAVSGPGVADAHPFRDASVRGVFFTHEWDESDRLDAGEAGESLMLPSGTPVRSKLQFTYCGADVLAAIPGLPERFSLGFLFGIRIYREHLEVETPQGSLDDRAGGCGIGPGLWSSWRPFDGIVLSGEISGYFWIGAPVSQAHLSAGFEWGGVRLEAGYRGLWIEGGAYDDLRLRLHGPTLGITISF
jgi:hypothetical protein